MRKDKTPLSRVREELEEKAGSVGGGNEEAWSVGYQIVVGQFLEYQG